MSTKTEHNDDADGLGLPDIDIPTIDKGWISRDLEILRSGTLADAEIICEGDATPRKVHRTILAARSDWFKTAFTGDFKEAKECKVHLYETPWQVDLMLYFLYTGGIDLKDEALTSGHDVMDISVELLRLGDYFQSTEMHKHGNNMLADYLRNFLSRICSSSSIFCSSPAVDKTSFDAETNFPERFCSAVVNAYNKERPVKPAQDILADFAFSARIHLFKNDKFLSFIRDGVVPEFGNRVLTALMDGSVSDAFKDNNAFQHWRDWQVTPKTGPPSMSQGSALFGTAPPAGTNASGTATPPVASVFGTTPPTATSGFDAAVQRAISGFSTPFSGVASRSGAGPPPVTIAYYDTAIPPAAGIPTTATPRVPSGFGTASPDVAGSGRGSGHGNGGGPGGGIGSTGTFAGAGTTGYDDLVSPGTASLAFSPCLELEPNSTRQNSFRNILFQEPYKKFSAEELRMEDYSQGRRYGSGTASGSNVFGTASGSGGGLFGNTIPQNSIFGNANNAGFGFGFGMATPK